MSKATTESIIAQLGFTEEMQQLREILDNWIRSANGQIRPLLEWQFITSSKYFRPLTVFSIYRATTDEPIPNRLIYSAAVIEMMHNMTLIIAGEDTGSMFETCACVATRDDLLRKFGGLLGVLYHGCDDVGDVKGLESLGGGGEEDLRDGILTLPASIAIKDPVIAELFCKKVRSDDELAQISRAVRAAVPAAEERLDQLAAEAKWEAHLHTANPALLYALVDHTRELSRR